MLTDFIKTEGKKSLIFRINRHRAWQVVRECAKKAGLPDLVNPETGKVRGVSPHRLRDAFAVHAVKLDDSGDGLRLLQEHLGHASFNTTARYRKVAGEEQREWYEKLWHEAQGEVSRPSGDFPRLGYKGRKANMRRSNKRAVDETKIAVQLELF
jgi:integrase/recombinase XerD